MRDKLELMILAVALAFLAGLCSAQSYHDGKYITGGYAYRCSSGTAAGLFLVGSDGSSSTLVVPGYTSYGWCMDVDNRKIVFTACTTTSTSTCYSGPASGVYRYDPGTMVLETLAGPDTMGLYSNYKIHVNQDGDFLFGNHAKSMVGTTTVYDSRVMKLSRSGTLSTFLSTMALGRRGYIHENIQRDIKTGNLLIADGSSHTTPSTFRYGILEVSPGGGTVNTWSTGGSYGWHGDYTMPQDSTTGYITGPDGRTVYQLKPGTTSRTTIATLTSGSYSNCKFDLQTAAARRWVGTAYSYSSTHRYEQWIGYVAHDGTGTVTSIKVTSFEQGKRAYYEDFEFFLNNPLTTEKLSDGDVVQMKIRMSCPGCPGNAYAIAAGITGVSPGIPLPDGRNINLNYDVFVYVTLNDLIPDIWKGGPGVLDGQGEASGILDLAPLSPPPGGFGIPIWIAMAVIDPNAPSGIKYIPDTIVVRI